MIVAGKAEFAEFAFVFHANGPIPAAASPAGARARSFEMQQRVDFDPPQIGTQCSTPIKLPRHQAKHRLLGVQPVFRFVEHHRMRSVDHLVGHLLAAMRRAGSA